jgi:DNA-binding MarR family transcriptional regulator
MGDNEKLTRQLFDIIAKLKRSGSNFNNAVNDDIRPSEEMFLIKINMLSNNSKTKVSDLVNTLRFAPSTVSTILKALESNEYIIRWKDENNRREVYVSLTDKGFLRLEKAREYHYKLVSDYISYLGYDDTMRLIEILEKTNLFFEKKKNERKNNDD